MQTCRCSRAWGEYPASASRRPHLGGVSLDDLSHDEVEPTREQGGSEAEDGLTSVGGVPRSGPLHPNVHHGLRCGFGGASADGERVVDGSLVGEPPVSVVLGEEVDDGTERLTSVFRLTGVPLVAEGAQHDARAVQTMTKGAPP